MAMPPPVPAPPLGVPGAGSGPAGGRLAGFEDNPYTLQRRGYVGPPPSKKKNNRPFLRVFVMVVLGAAAAFVAYRLTHPSPHRSATAVALDFYEDLQQGDSGAAVADVVPQEQGTVTAVLDQAQVRQFVQSDLQHVSVQAGTTDPSGADTSVVLQVCGSNLSCSPTIPVPTTKVGGDWYVDWNSWLRTLTPVGGFPAG